MTKKKAVTVKYLVLRSFGRDGRWRHEAGAVIDKSDIPGEAIDRLIQRGVLQPVAGNQNGDSAP